MKRFIIIVFFLGLGMTVFAQSNNTKSGNYSNPNYTCPTGIKPASQSKQETKVTTCTTTTATILGNGVTNKQCTQTNSDGSTTRTTTTCVTAGVKGNVGVGEMGISGERCVEKKETTPPNR
jgi:hypothetical protein